MARQGSKVKENKMASGPNLLFNIFGSKLTSLINVSSSSVRTVEHEISLTSDMARLLLNKALSSDSPKCCSEGSPLADTQRGVTSGVMVGVLFSAPSVLIGASNELNSCKALMDMSWVERGQRSKKTYICSFEIIN